MSRAVRTLQWIVILAVFVGAFVVARWLPLLLPLAVIPGIGVWWHSMPGAPGRSSRSESARTRGRRGMWMQFAGAATLFAVVCVGSTFSYRNPLRRTTERFNYAGVLRESSGFLDHFPQEWPDDAIEVRFSHQPGMIVPGTFSELLVRTSAAEARRQADELATRALWACSGPDPESGHYGDSDWPEGAPPIWVPITILRYDSSVDAWPRSFRHYVLGPNRLAAQYESGVWEDDSGYWNHGTIRGVSVDVADATIVYWAASW